MPPPPVATHPLTDLEEWCSGTGVLPHVLPHALSLAHDLLIAPREDYQPPSISRWERVPNCTFTTQKKQQILTLTNHPYVPKYRKPIIKSLGGTGPQLYFISSSRQRRTNIGVAKMRGTLLHIFWTCPRIRNFWGEIRQIMQKFTDGEIPEEPAYFLLHATDTPLRIYRRSVIRHLLDAAKACIPLRWKSLHPPTIAMWLQKVDENKM